MVRRKLIENDSDSGTSELPELADHTLTRVSNRSQTDVVYDGNTQRQEVQLWAKTFGISIHYLHNFNDVSPGDDLGRKGLATLIGLVHRGGKFRIWCRDISRFSREGHSGYNLLCWLITEGCEFFCKYEDFHKKSPGFQIRDIYDLGDAVREAFMEAEDQLATKRKGQAESNKKPSTGRPRVRVTRKLVEKIIAERKETPGSTYARLCEDHEIHISTFKRRRKEFGI